MNWHNFPYVCQAKHKLIKACYPSGELSSESSKPAWKKDDLYYIMKQLVRSKSGCVSYASLCEELGSPVVDSLIEHKILHLRPIYSYDLPNQSEGEVVVTAESPSLHYVMKHLIKELQFSNYIGIMTVAIILSIPVFYYKYS